MSRLVHGVRNALGWALTLATASRMIIDSHINDPRRSWLKLRTPWAHQLMKLLNVRIRVLGTFQEPCVIVSNHQSLLDILALPAVLPKQCLIVGKKELRKIPLFGKAYFECGGIMIDRKDPEGAKRAIEKGMQELPKGWSLMIFPEGTRSYDHHVLPFKKGFLHMAKTSRMPVLPIGLDGCQDAMLGHVVIQGGDVVVSVGDPIPWEFLDNMPTDEATAYVRAAVEVQVAKARAARLGV